MWWLATLALLAAANAQIPSLGWCPDYQPMANFNMNRFLGSWHEAERYFTVTELGSRCVTTTYEKKPDGRVWVSNEIRNSLWDDDIRCVAGRQWIRAAECWENWRRIGEATGTKRVMDGTLQLIGREGEGKVMVKYNSLPLPYDAEYFILDTDYDNYAVVWSCSGIGPVHTQNAWVLTRERLANSAIMQSAYGILDKFKISRAFFVKTNQEDCSVLPQPVEAVQSKSAQPDVVVQDAQVGPDPVVVEKNNEAEPKGVGKSNLPLAAVAAPEEPMKAPMPVPELIMKEAEMEKEKPMEEPPKIEPMPEIKASNVVKEEAPPAL